MTNNCIILVEPFNVDYNGSVWIDFDVTIDMAIYSKKEM